MYHWKKIVLNGLPLLFICLLVEVLVGQILLLKEEVLLSYLPIFLISIPVINGVGGNIGSILGAHLASGLHVGSVQLSIKDSIMHETVITAMIMGTVTYAFLSIGIYLIGVFNGLTMNVTLFSFVSTFLLTGILLVGLLSVVSVVTAFISFKKGIDPDDVVAPVVTTIGDSFGILILFLFIGV
jgi:mgtE-like transporter